MKNKIIEICELGQPQSIIHRENEPITELIKTDSLIEELNKQLTLTDVRLSLFNEVYDKFVECEDDNEFTQYLNEKTNEA